MKKHIKLILIMFCALLGYILPTYASKTTSSSATSNTQEVEQCISISGTDVYECNGVSTLGSVTTSPADTQSGGTESLIND
jgi:hypothetical protein